MKNDNIVEELINFSDKDVKLLSDEDIAAQYDNFECTSISVEPSRVHDNWYNFTLELEFPDADHPDFSDYVIENVYYDADADRWGFDNWYPEETSKQLKDLMLKELEKEGYLKPDDEDYDLEAIGLVNGTTDIVVVKNNKTGLYQLNKFDKNESDRIGHMIATKTFETETEAEEWYLSWSKSRGNNDIAESLLNEISDEVVSDVTGRRASDYIWTKMHPDENSPEDTEKMRKKLARNLDLVNKRNARKDKERGMQSESFDDDKQYGISLPKVGNEIEINYYTDDPDLAEWLDENPKGAYKVTEVDTESGLVWVEGCPYAIWPDDILKAYDNPIHIDNPIYKGNKENNMQNDGIAESLLNEGAGATVTFHFNPSDRDWNVSTDLTSEGTIIKVSDLLITDYYNSAHADDGGYITFDLGKVKEAVVHFYNEYDRLTDEPEIKLEDITEINEINPYEIPNLIYSWGWIRAELPQDTVLNWEKNNQTGYLPQVEVIFTINGEQLSSIVAVDGEYHISEDVYYAYRDLDKYEDEYEDEYEESYKGVQVLNTKVNNTSNNVIAEDLLNEISDELATKVNKYRKADMYDAEKKLDGNIKAAEYAGEDSDDEDVKNYFKAKKKLKKNNELMKNREKKDTNESQITEEDLNDLLSMSGERYTDISDLDMPEPLADAVPTTENGEPITLELLYKAISELTASMTELATAIKQPKVELQPLENPMGQPAPTEVEEIAEPEEDTDAEKEHDEDKVPDTDDEDNAESEEDLEELDKEIEADLKKDKKDNKEDDKEKDDDKGEKSGKNEDLNTAKEEIDKAIRDKKSPEEIDATIDYTTDNEYDEKAANEYKIAKMKEDFRQSRLNSLLHRLKWGM